MCPQCFQVPEFVFIDCVHMAASFSARALPPLILLSSLREGAKSDDAISEVL
ncbi:MAG TPA: hypothetical protein VKL21_08840 [Candidatus Methanoperedens sp.]|nr:hypothetical protein [Candidatus Methanoperedens sp.]